MKKIKIIAVVLAILTSAVAFVGCSNNGGIKADGTVIIGATSTPHAEILEFAKPLLAEKGLKIEVKLFSGYELENPATSNGDIYANYFQHTPYLNDYNEKSLDAKNRQLAVAGIIHFEPLGLYKGGLRTAPTTLDEAKQSQNMKILISRDAANGARGLLLLESCNIITRLPNSANKQFDVTVYDYNLNGHTIIENDPATIPATKVDADLAVVNGNYALEANLPATEKITSEPSDGVTALTYGNIIAVRADCKDSEISKTLVEVLKSKAVADFIIEKYKGVVVSVG